MRFLYVKDLIARQIRRFHDTEGDMQAKWKALIRMSKKDAEQLTSGNVSAHMLRQLGWPFARIGRSNYRPAGSMRGARAVGRQTVERMLGRSTIPKLPINMQRGRLHDSMTIFNIPEMAQGDISAAVGPNPAVAGKAVNVLKLEGTFQSGRYRGGMVARGFWQEMQRRFKARVRAFLGEMQKSTRNP